MMKKLWVGTAIFGGVGLCLVLAPLAGWAHASRERAGGLRGGPADSVSLRAGAFGALALGQSLAEARRALATSVVSSPAKRVTPLDAASAPIGVSYFPGDVVSIRARGVSLLAERGRVRMMFITDHDAVTLGGVRVGDDLRDVRARLSGLICRQSNEDVPTCGGRAGRYTALFVGDPVETITLSSIDTGWCFVRSDTCHSTTRRIQIAAR